MAYFQVNKKPRLTFPTLTGSIVTFNSQYAGLPLKSHKVNIDSVSGVSAINISATGKNIYSMTERRFIVSIPQGTTIYYASDIDITGTILYFGYTDGTTGNTPSLGENFNGSFTLEKDCNVIAVNTPSYNYAVANNKIIEYAFQPITSIEEYNGTQTTINIGQTVNEGEYDARTGILEATLPSVQTIQLPPCPIDTLEGVNNIWADTGDTTLQYPKFG